MGEMSGLARRLLSSAPSYIRGESGGEISSGYIDGGSGMSNFGGDVCLFRRSGDGWE